MSWSLFGVTRKKKHKVMDIYTAIVSYAVYSESRASQDWIFNYENAEQLLKEMMNLGIL